MTRHAIRVECYAGGRADERPRRVMIEGRQHIVARLLAESVEQSQVSGARTRRYRVLTVEGLVLEIVCTSGGDWFLHSSKSVRKPES